MIMKQLKTALAHLPAKPYAIQMIARSGKRVTVCFEDDATRAIRRARTIGLVVCHVQTDRLYDATSDRWVKPETHAAIAGILAQREATDHHAGLAKLQSALGVN